MRDVLAASDAAWSEKFAEQLRRVYRGERSQSKLDGLTADAGTDDNDVGLAAKWIDPTTLADKPVPEREWLVLDWIPMQRVTGLYGAGGEGKTLLAQQLATSCSVGALWLGLRVRECNSLLIFWVRTGMSS